MPEFPSDLPGQSDMGYITLLTSLYFRHFIPVFYQG